MPRSAKQSLATIEDFLRAVGSLRKRAADPISEPGNLEGEDSEHPSAEVDDGLMEVPPEGEWAKETSRHVVETAGPNSVENDKSAASRRGHAKKSESNSSDDNYGVPGEMTVAPTMGDPNYSSDKAKDTKDDPGSEHPARTDNPEVGDKEKYAWDKMPLEKLAAEFARLGEAICADVAALTGVPLTKEAMDLLSRTDDAALAAAAGWEAAEAAQLEKLAQELDQLDPQWPEKLAAELALAEQAQQELDWLQKAAALDPSLVQEEPMDKQAVDALIKESIDATIKSAEDLADMTAGFLDGYLNTLLKSAEEPVPPEVLEQMADAPPPSGVDPAAAGAAAEAGPSEEELLAALAEGGGEAPEGEGSPDEAEAEEAAMQLAEILEQAGVTPEELSQAMSDGGEGMEVQAADRQRKPNKKATASTNVKHMGQYIAELIRRSRG